LLCAPSAGQNSRVNTFLATFDTVIAVARVAILASALIVAVMCVGDWAVRTRRISPFSSIARFFRKSVDPLLAPIERRIIRGGGVPSQAPWWGLAAVVGGGIIVIWLLGFIRDQAEFVVLTAGAGARGIARLVLTWVFDILQIALLVRVIASWFRASGGRWWVRWAETLTEPMLRPLRQLIPPIGGMLDVTPIVAWILLTVLSALVMSALRL